jgi:hypothetical protein
MRLSVAALALAAAGTLWAGESAYVPKAADLRERPDSQAKVVAQVEAGRPVELLSRQGAWVQVRSAGLAGWLRLEQVRIGQRAAALPTTARPGVPLRPSRSGIRGFSEEELLVGSPNESEGARLRQLQVSAALAANFARASSLRPRRWDYFEMSDYVPEGGLPPEFFDD